MSPAPKDESINEPSNTASEQSCEGYDWLLLFVDASNFTGLTSMSPSNDLIDPLEGLATDEEFQSRCVDKREGWIEALEQDAFAKDSSEVSRSTT